MKIYDSFPLKNFLMDMNNSKIKEGDIITGEILDMSEETILLDLENVGKVKGKNEFDIDYPKFNKVSFLVKSISNGKLELAPISDIKDPKLSLEKFENKKITDKIFNEYNISQDEISEEFVESLLEYNVPINKENIIKGLKTIGKIEEILGKANEEKIILFNNINDPIKEEIRNFLIVNKEEYPEKEDLNYIYDHIKDMLPEEKMSSWCIKSIAFILKNDMKISINNLEKFFLILEGKEIISKDDVEHLLGFLDKEDGYEKYSLSFKDRSLLTFTGKDSQYIKNYYDELNEKIDEINNKIKNGISKVDKNTKETFEKLSDSLDFLNNINKDMAFIYVPITIKNQENKGAISILKKRKENFNKGDKISIFINLDMSHLNRVKIYCEFKAELVSISFDLTKENVSLFKKNETMLENIIEENGYKLNNINYIEDKEMNFLDTLVDNKNPYYYLDVRV